MKRTYIFAFIFLQILQIAVSARNKDKDSDRDRDKDSDKDKDQSFYTIVCPGTIQSNTTFSVGVTLHQGQKSATFKLDIEGPSYNESKSIDVASAEMKVVNFTVPKIASGLYVLNLSGVKGINVENFTNLIYRDRNPAVYIQTSKAIYKPGDLVQYRIVVLDEEVRPVAPEEPLNFTLRDGGGNFVKQTNGIKLTKGVYSGELQLSEEPVLGDWMMEISMLHDEDIIKAGKKFEVAKYVLPKYSFDIESSPHITYNDPIKITIRAQYTYGKSVRGRATVKVSAKYDSLSAEKVIDVDGKGHVEFDLLRDLNVEAPKSDGQLGAFTFHYPSPVKITTTMVEEHTGNKLDQSTTIYLHKSRYLIEITKKASEYYANIPFEIHAVVKTVDGWPAQDGKHMAKLMIDKSNRYNSPEEPEEGQYIFSSELDKDGRAVFKVVLPIVEMFHSVKVIYKDQFEYLDGLKGRDENEMKDSTIKLVKTTQGLPLDKEIVVEVRFNKPLEYFVYAIVARGNIIIHEYVKLPGSTTSHEIKFMPSFTMVPESSLYVYCVIDGNLRFEEMKLSFPREFQNKIEIIAPTEAKPSEKVTLKIKTEPDSFVGLMGVDQSVLLLKSGNDLSYNDIMEDLDSRNTATPHIAGSGVYPGKISGLVTLTNANYPFTLNYRPHIYYPYYGMPGTYLRGPGPSPSYYTTTSLIQDRILSGFPGPIKPATIFKEKPKLKPKVRKNFAEVWFFNNFNNDSNGVITITKNIPDTITSWVITGFSVNDKHGFGMVTNPTNIKVFQPFFAATNLPYSVKRGEVLSVLIVLFNYMDKTLDAEVTMENVDGDYDFTEASNEVDELILTGKQRVKRISVPSNIAQGVSFMIRPNRVGDITLRIKATTALAGDALNKKLKVEAEGATQYGNQALFVTPTSLSPSKEVLSADIPKDVVLDSEYLEFSVVGDILGPTIKNIDNLVHKPDGCGEQNMVNFVPNILVMHYAEALQLDMPDVRQRAITFMEIGYQRELIYRHGNGAYSAFGEDSSEPNSWLTAYVARSFIQAQKYISIDQSAIDDALKYVLSNQLGNGKFKQTGRLFHPSHQNDVGFTAFALLPLLESNVCSEKYKTEIEKGIQYISDSIERESDTYALAIAMLVLRKAPNATAAADKLMAKLEQLAHEEGGLKWWAKSSTANMLSNNIEITAYILQAYVYTEPVGKLLPIVRWLIGHRNNLGGFDATQDTVVGLQALITFAEKHIGAGLGKMTISFEGLDAQGRETTRGNFIVDKDSSLTVQSHVLPKSSRQIKLQAEGDGSALVYLSYRYNLATKDNKPSFNIRPTVLKTSQSNMLKLHVCTDYVPAGSITKKESNMAIMEIFLPSGFTVDVDELDKLRKSKRVQRVEAKNENTAIVIYYDYLTSGEELCLEVNAERNFAVAKQKPAAITMYDYYNSEERATVYYEVKSSLCDICEEGECGKGCTKK